MLLQNTVTIICNKYTWVSEYVIYWDKQRSQWESKWVYVWRREPESIQLNSFFIHHAKSVTIQRSPSLLYQHNIPSGPQNILPIYTQTQFSSTHEIAFIKHTQLQEELLFYPEKAIWLMIHFFCGKKKIPTFCRRMCAHAFSWVTLMIVNFILIWISL